MHFKTIRKLVIEDKINEAIQILLNEDNIDIKNKVTMLGSQYNTWKSNEILDIGAPKEERNRIVYEILTLVTETEKTKATGKKLKKLENLAEVEKELSVTFDKLSSLRNKGAIDLFMNWFRKNYPDLYRKVLIEEKTTGKVTNLTTILSSLNLNEFKLEYGLNPPTEQIKDYISRKNDEIPNFFAGWIDYNKHKNNEIKALVNLIPEKFKKHKRLLSAMIGGFFGAFTFHIMENYLDNLLEDEDDIDEDSEIDDD